MRDTTQICQLLTSKKVILNYKAVKNNFKNIFISMAVKICTRNYTTIHLALFKYILDAKDLFYTQISPSLMFLKSLKN